MKKIIDIFRLLRFTQWLKNMFLFAPLIFSRHLFEGSYLRLEALAFISFCIISSVIYIINDIVDRRVDRLHPIKKNRPIASGSMRPAEAIIIAVVLLCILFSLTPFLTAYFWYTVILYAALNLVYSFWLKQIVLVDVFIVAAGFMLRVLAGVFSIEVEISSWLVLCTLFVSVFLAVSKRRGELMLATSSNSFAARPVLKQYNVEFMDQIMTIAASGMAISYALYTVAERTISIYKTENLIFTTVFVLFGIFRYIFIMRRRKKEDNPMHLLLRDIPLLVNILLWFFVCVLIIYIM